MLEGGPQVVEVTAKGKRPIRRMLDATEAAPILKDLKQVYAKSGTYAAFSWDELERLACYSIQDLALVLDGPTKAADRVDFGNDTRLRITASTTRC